MVISKTHFLRSSICLFDEFRDQKEVMGPVTNNLVLMLSAARHLSSCYVVKIEKCSRSYFSFSLSWLKKSWRKVWCQAILQLV